MIYFTINFWLSGFLFSHLPLFILIAWLISSLSFISPDEVLWMDWSRKLDWEHCDQEQQSEALPLFLSQRVPAWTGYQAGRPLWAPVPRSTHLWKGKSFKSATFSLHLTLEVILENQNCEFTHEANSYSSSFFHLRLAWQYENKSLL